MVLSVLVAFSLPYGLGTVVSASQLGPLPEAVRSPVPLASLHLGGTTGVVRFGSQKDDDTLLNKSQASDKSGNRRHSRLMCPMNPVRMR